MNNANFWQLYSEAALTSLSFFWKALWAFILGYIVSSAIQVFVTRERMKQTMGEAGKSSVALGTFFGFISSSCSFAALATTKALFKKGAGFVPSLAFLLASTNLVIELGFIIAIFLGWQFVVGEYLGGILLIIFMWIIVRFTRPKELIRKARRRLREKEGEEEEGEEVPDWKEKMQSKEGWEQVARRYFMEWNMVWKDVTIGFTVAGVIAVFVPRSFFQFLFIGSGQGSNPSFLAVLENAVIGPVAAFFTFIGSMGNIPLASVLFANGVSFAGIMAFIFSDLVVFPIIRVNAKYYGWKVSLYIVGVFFAALVVTAIAMHYGFALFGLLPQGGGQSAAQTQRFAIDYTFFLNLGFLAVTGVLAWLRFGGDKKKGGMHHGGGKSSIIERVLFWLAIVSYIWLAGGLMATFFS
ncbi:MULTISPECIES: permease [unclassified Coleofasciculus]|uniref:permease n=1 Tax=unclassified Coleofasciculus TaxID=2692782 RepID=UPI00188025CB|nr:MULTISPECIES: permease [unclassified Coleofasciculus]MBE9129277.1 permease [Coleofasciculus sp. LEGE 07081]MBE9151915.1 permease [Coleofasciculus sp. LEGE 07092]